MWKLHSLRGHKWSLSYLDYFLTSQRHTTSSPFSLISFQIKKKKGGGEGDKKIVRIYFFKTNLKTYFFFFPSIWILTSPSTRYQRSLPPAWPAWPCTTPPGGHQTNITPVPRTALRPARLQSTQQPPQGTANQQPIKASLTVSRSALILQQNPLSRPSSRKKQTVSV